MCCFTSHRFSKCNEKAFAASSFIRFASSARLVKLPGVLCRFKGQQKCNTNAASSLSVVTQQLSMLEKLCSFCCCSVPEVCSLSFKTAACKSLNYCAFPWLARAQEQVCSPSSNAFSELVNPKGGNMEWGNSSSYYSRISCLTWVTLMYRWGTKQLFIICLF